MNSLPKTVTRQRRGCDLNPGPTAPESSTLTTRLPSHRCCTPRKLSTRRGLLHMTKPKLLHSTPRDDGDLSADCSDFARRSRDSIHTACHDTDRTVLSCLAGGVNWALACNLQVRRRSAAAEASSVPAQHDRPATRAAAAAAASSKTPSKSDEKNARTPAVVSPRQTRSRATAGGKDSERRHKDEKKVHFNVGAKQESTDE